MAELRPLQSLSPKRSVYLASYITAVTCVYGISQQLFPLRERVVGQRFRKPPSYRSRFSPSDTGSPLFIKVARRFLHHAYARLNILSVRRFRPTTLTRLSYPRVFRFVRDGNPVSRPANGLSGVRQVGLNTSNLFQPANASVRTFRSRQV